MIGVDERVRVRRRGGRGRGGARRQDALQVRREGGAEAALPRMLSYAAVEGLLRRQRVAKAGLHRVHGEDVMRTAKLTYPSGFGSASNGPTSPRRRR